MVQDGTFKRGQDNSFFLLQPKELGDMKKYAAFDRSVTLPFI